MKLTALGVGDAFSQRHYSTCFLVEHAGCRLLVDCPHPIRKILAEAGAGVDLPHIQGVILTHLHADHCSGLEGFGFFNHFVRGAPLPLLAHPRVSARLWERLAPGMDRLVDTVDTPPVPHGLEDFWALHALSLDAVVRFGPFEIETRFTKHHIPTTALRIHAGGATLGYSADTSFDPDLIDWLAPAQLIIHETNLGIHTHLDQLLGLPRALQAKMHLVHFPDSLDQATSSIPFLREGQVIEL